MADRPDEKALRASRLVNQDTVQIEFLIDDLVKQLITDRARAIASCNGCNNCSASVELPRTDQRLNKGGQ